MTLTFSNQTQQVHKKFTQIKTGYNIIDKLIDIRISNISSD